MTSLVLPPFGWKAHSEQTDAAALAAHAWGLSTEMLLGVKVVTAQLSEPPEDIIERMEKIAEHHATCKNPTCTVGHAVLSGASISELCPNGRFVRGTVFFFTTAVDPFGVPFHELRCLSKTPEDAKKAHYGAVAMLAAAGSSWAPFKNEAV